MENANYTVLLVDDSSVNNILLENILADEGYEIKTSFSAKEALNVLKKDKVDIILLDIMMPKTNGLELLEKINELYADRNIPVIMVSALKEKEERKRAAELGAVDYLTKPIDVNNVIETVENTLKARQS